MSASPVVLRRTTIGYVHYKPAGRFYEARSAAPDVAVGAFPTAREARQAIFADRSVRQAALRRKAAPQYPAGAKPVFRGERMIGWISAGDGGFDAVLAASGEVLGPFPVPTGARNAINSAWSKSRSKLAPVYGMAARRRAELVRLARHRRQHGQEIKPRAMALAMADALLFSLTGADYAAMLELGRAGNIVRACDVRLEEDDISSADSPGRAATLKHLSSVGALGATTQDGVLADDDIVSAVLKVSAIAKARGRAYRPFAARAVAGMLDVKLAEKLELELHTIAAVDETPEQAKERQRAARRDYERDRNKRRRLERGAVPREQSLSRTQPWTAAGVSRSTWYARRKEDQRIREYAAPNKAECSEKADTCKPNATVGHIRPLPIPGKGFASAAVQSVQFGSGRYGQAVMGHQGDDGGRIIEFRRGPAPSSSPSSPTPSATSTGQDRTTGLAADTSLCAGYHLLLQRATPTSYEEKAEKSLRYYDDQFAKAHPEIANPEFRERRLKIFEAHRMRVLKLISDKDFAARLKEAGTGAPLCSESAMRPENDTARLRSMNDQESERAQTERAPRVKLVTDADLKRLREIANRLRWKAGLATKLSSEEIMRLLTATPAVPAEADIEADDDEEEAVNDRERDWLQARYERMNDELLCEQIGWSEEVPFAEEMNDLLDGETDYRRNRTRSRVIDYLVRRDLRAAA